MEQNNILPVDKPNIRLISLNIAKDYINSNNIQHLISVAELIYDYVTKDCNIPEKCDYFEILKETFNKIDNLNIDKTEDNKIISYVNKDYKFGSNYDKDKIMIEITSLSNVIEKGFKNHTISIDTYDMLKASVRRISELIK